VHFSAAILHVILIDHWLRTIQSWKQEFPHNASDFGVRLVGWTRYGKGSQVSGEWGEHGRCCPWITYRNSHVMRSTLLDEKA